jgi:putative spermidine/putrescine transport system substrate-binding protein
MRYLKLGRRAFLAGGAAVAGSALLGHSAFAQGSVTAAMYPGTWEEAYRTHVAPALKKAHDVDL